MVTRFFEMGLRMMDAASISAYSRLANVDLRQ
jgi:hypothetical protein